MLALERPLARNHLEEHATQRPDIRAAIDDFAPSRPREAFRIGNPISPLSGSINRGSEHVEGGWTDGQIRGMAWKPSMLPDESVPIVCPKRA
jgi:hypothetical protein